VDFTGVTNFYIGYAAGGAITYTSGTSVLLGTMNIDRKVRDALSDPNQTLGRVLGMQLQPKGVQLTGLGLHFNEKNLFQNINLV